MTTTAGRNTYRWRQVSAQVKAEEHTCHLCHRAIDWTLPAGHPAAGTIDHLVPLAYLAPTDPRREDRTNLRAAHRRCNSARGAQTLIAQPTRRW